MSNEKPIINKKRNNIDIHFLSKEIDKSIDKYQKQKYNAYTLNDNIIQKMSIYEEDDSYDSFVYDTSISKDNLFLYKKNKKSIFFNTISSYNCFNSIKDRFNKNKQNFFLEDNISVDLNKEKLNLNFSSQEKKGEDYILLNEDNNKNENYLNLIKNINIFSSLHKKFRKKYKNKDINLNKNVNNNKRFNIKKSKFSRKNKKKYSNTKENDNYHIYDRKNTEMVIDLSNSMNKLIKIDYISNISSNIDKNIINKISNKGNFKLYDAYIISSDLEKNLTEKDKDVIFKDKKQMRKINISFDQNIKEEKLNINRPKISKHLIQNSSSNFYNINNDKIKTSINNYISKDNNRYSNSMNNSKKNLELNMNRIITKRVILEEEYMLSPQGDKKLLSVKRIEDNIKDWNNPFNNLYSNFKSEKNVNSNRPLNYRNSLNNSLFSSIFREKSKQKLYNRTVLKSIDEDSLIISDTNNHKNEYDEQKNSISNHMNIKITNKNLERANLKKEKKHEHNNKSDLNSKDINNKKDFLYNKICLLKDKNINKFNKSCLNSNSTKNQNSIMNHTNYFNTNISSMNYNYLEDKEKSRLDSKKTIYDKISFAKEQPFMISHKDQQEPNLIINNNQNCPNLVNIVFYNQEEKNNKNNIGKNKYFHINKLNLPQPRNSNLRKKSNYRFHEIKSISIDNCPPHKSSRNYLNNNESHKFSNKNNSYYELDNMNNKLNLYAYSSMDNLNKKNNYY